MRDERPELRSRDCAKHRQPGPVTVHTLRLLDLTHERNAKKLTRNGRKAKTDAGQLNAL